LEVKGFDLMEVVLAKEVKLIQIQVLVAGAIGSGIFQGQKEEAGGGGEALAVYAVVGVCVVELEVHEGPGPLDQSFVEGIVRTLLPLGQPQFFENIVGFVIKLAVEAGKVGRVMRVPDGMLAPGHQFADAGGFLAHAEP
jgi:hypothetical protein